MVKLQETNKGQFFITVPQVIVKAMGARKGDKMIFRWNGTNWELRRD